jgi:hypothetical protein
VAEFASGIDFTKSPHILGRVRASLRVCASTAA